VTSARGLRLARSLKERALQRSRGLEEVREQARRFRSLSRYDTAEALDLIVEWTRARLSYAKAKGAVFGVSGGVDSTLTACVLARAAPGKVTAFVLPCGSKAVDERDARELCRALKIPVEKIDLQPAFEAVRALFSKSPKGSNADGNLKTRLRTMALFHEAMVRGALFVGTGDLDEGYVGYYTKGSGSDLAPIASLHKDEVRALVRVALGKKAPALARRLSNKPADAGLSGRLAEDELGVTYGEIAGALEVVFQACSVFEGGLVPKDPDLFAEVFERSGLSEKAFLKVADRVYQARHKAFGAPVLWREDWAPNPFEELESE
jgi:NAD+ synthase